MTSSDKKDPGYLYEIGISCCIGHKQPLDPVKGAEYLTESSDMGYLPASRELGLLYLTGTGVNKDPVKAYELIKTAADNMDPAAIYHLGRMYEHGEGVEKDLYEAFRLMAFAAGMGLDGASADADRLESLIDEQRIKNLNARPILNLDISDVDIEAVCCRKMMNAVSAKDVYVLDTYMGPELIRFTEDEEVPITKCPFCGKKARRVLRNKIY